MAKRATRLLSRRRGAVLAAGPLVIGLAAAAAAAVVAGGVGAVLRTPAVAAQALPAAAGSGAAGVAITVTISLWRGTCRTLLAGMAGAAAAAAALLGLGEPNVAAMSTGVEMGCSLGLPRCISTHVQDMPLLVHAGPVQRRPVIHVVLWGLPGPIKAAVSAEESQAGRLGQPLLHEDYGIEPARPGGIWSAPGSPSKWLRAHHDASLPKVELAKLVHEAARARGWKDTADTQWWIATSIDHERMGLSSGCADHIEVPSVNGVVVRLPLQHCSLPPTRYGPCAAVTVVSPSVPEPVSQRAGIEILIGHEFAEAATDPSDGWRVLVAPRCTSDSWLEIADVCTPDGAYIRTPSYHTAAGWQPALLATGRGGRRAYCANPAAPVRG